MEANHEGTGRRRAGYEGRSCSNRGLLKPDKAKSAEKIDGIVAGIMALGRAMVAVRSDSIYEQRGPIFV
jgi:hypothetical protein